MTLESLAAKLQLAFADKLLTLEQRLREITTEAAAANLLEIATRLRDEFAFEQLIDLAAVDYRDYGEGDWSGRRFAVVYHLLSVSRNQRLRLRAFVEDDDFPVIDSVLPVWASADWYEREAFDLMGIIFTGHPDLRRILTDYGFIGHPFRKDFPMVGQVEMRYDPDSGRVIYQPVTIENRVLTPRVIREEKYGDTGEDSGFGIQESGFKKGDA
ncbi:MAG TPA: NADH-quinone oxidoreductase subunit C [Burkholderiales bacterium]|nr:NADH-quinone oxidoreductase subunit C [Burkholderiales bacterium]